MTKWTQWNSGLITSGIVSPDVIAFVAVAEEGGFTAAADRLGLTSSAVSKMLARLEDRLGARLVHRTTRSVRLSDAGASFLPHAREALTLAETAVADVDALNRAPSGTLRISVGAAFAKHRLAPMLPSFLASCPGVRIELNVTDHLVDPRTEGIDIAIRPIREGQPPPADLFAQSIGTARRHLCASPAYLASHGTPATPAELTKHSCLVMAGVGLPQHWPFKINGRHCEIGVSGPLSTDNPDILLDAALAGMGIVRLLDTIAATSLAEGRLVPVLSDLHLSDCVHITALARKGRERLPRMRAFLDFLTKEDANSQVFTI